MAPLDPPTFRDFSTFPEHTAGSVKLGAVAGSEKASTAPTPLVERPASGEFVALALPQPAGAAVACDIRLELRRAGITINVSWPTSAAAECAALLREMLR